MRFLGALSGLAAVLSFSCATLDSRKGNVEDMPEIPEAKNVLPVPEFYVGVPHGSFMDGGRCYKVTDDNRNGTFGIYTKIMIEGTATEGFLRDEGDGIVEIDDWERCLQDQGYKAYGVETLEGMRIYSLGEFYL